MVMKNMIVQIGRHSRLINRYVLKGDLMYYKGKSCKGNDENLVIVFCNFTLLSNWPLLKHLYQLYFGLLSYSMLINSFRFLQRGLLG